MVNHGRSWSIAYGSFGFVEGGGNVDDYQGSDKTGDGGGDQDAFHVFFCVQ